MLLLSRTSLENVTLMLSLASVLLATILVPTLALSVQPHQEPRFLVPLVVPVTALAARAPFLRDRSPKGRRRRRLFWVSDASFRPSLSSSDTLLQPPAAGRLALASGIVHRPVRLPTSRWSVARPFCTQSRAFFAEDRGQPGRNRRPGFLAHFHAASPSPASTRSE